MQGPAIVVVRVEGVPLGRVALGGDTVLFLGASRPGDALNVGPPRAGRGAIVAATNAGVAANPDSSLDPFGGLRDGANR